MDDPHVILDQNADIDTYIVAADAVADPSCGCMHGMDGTDYFLLLLFLFLFHHPLLQTMSMMARTWDTAAVVAAAVIGGDDDDIVAVVEYGYW